VFLEKLNDSTRGGVTGLGKELPKKHRTPKIYFCQDNNRQQEKKSAEEALKKSEARENNRVETEW